ncbi:MAG: hypothetical protein ACI8XC_001965, partial [Gammaproteobacteria bacterium]
GVSTVNPMTDILVINPSSASGGAFGLFMMKFSI